MNAHMPRRRFLMGLGAATAAAAVPGVALLWPLGEPRAPWAPLATTALEPARVAPDPHAACVARAKQVDAALEAFRERNAAALQAAQRRVRDEFDVFRSHAPEFGERLNDIGTQFGYLWCDVRDTSEAWILFWRTPQQPDRRTQYIQDIFADCVVNDERLQQLVDDALWAYTYDLRGNLEEVLYALRQIDGVEAPAVDEFDQYAPLARALMQPEIDGADFATHMRLQILLLSPATEAILGLFKFIPYTTPIALAVDFALDSYLDNKATATWTDAGIQFVDELERNFFHGVDGEPGFRGAALALQQALEAEIAAAAETWHEPCIHVGTQPTDEPGE